MKRHGEPINPLYALGFDRVGCAPCINSGKDDILNWAERFPEMIDKIRSWEATSGHTFFMPLYRNVPNNIDQAVEWARTSRGGRDIFLPMITERSGCESNYGLCE